MPSKPKKPCKHSTCYNLTDNGYCEQHEKIQKEKIQRYDKERGTASERGYGYRWQKARKTFLSRNPLCVCDECKERIVPLPANVVDHIIPHRGDQKLFWDKKNWQPMNKRCHDKKTSKEDGGFGR